MDKHNNVLKLIYNLQFLFESIKDSEPKITELQINNFESQIRNKLPLEYKTFLLKNNGGYPTRNRIDLAQGGSVVNNFYSISNNYNNSLLSNFKTYIGRIPNNTLPIAGDPFGNQFLIDLKTGKIYFWDHEIHDVDEDDPPLSINKIVFVANDFKQFLNNLY